MFELSDSVIINNEKELLEYIKQQGKEIHKSCVVLEYPYWITKLNEFYITTKDKPIRGTPLPIKAHSVKWSE